MCWRLNGIGKENPIIVRVAKETKIAGVEGFDA